MTFGAFSPWHLEHFHRDVWSIFTVAFGAFSPWHLEIFIRRARHRKIGTFLLVPHHRPALDQAVGQRKLIRLKHQYNRVLKTLFTDKSKKNLSTRRKSSTFAADFTHTSGLSYGVMVAHQILVLLVQVRILVGQQKHRLEPMLFLCTTGQAFAFFSYLCILYLHHQTTAKH